MLDSGANLNLATTLIGFVLSCGLIMFVCARTICGRNPTVDFESAPYELEMHRAQQNIPLPECTIDGLDRVAISAIPTVKYNRQSSNSAEEQCTICLGEYEEREVLRIMPTCGHKYHMDCIDTWFESHSTCPICRVSLYDSFQDNTLSRNEFYRHFVDQWDASHSLESVMNVNNVNV